MVRFTDRLDISITVVLNVKPQNKQILKYKKHSREQLQKVLFLSILPKVFKNQTRPQNLDYTAK